MSVSIAGIDMQQFAENYNRLVKAHFRLEAEVERLRHDVKNLQEELSTKVNKTKKESVDNDG